MLASLYSVGSPSVSFEVIFVDNCSTDGTADYIRNNYPTIKLIENQRNMVLPEIIILEQNML
ncbi:hypothetical protein NXY26_03695 [Parabacteroides distasonis]|nr:hypothetical protein NXY26_03695 [Parabacteroides distasonis]